jgi:integrase
MRTATKALTDIAIKNLPLPTDGQVTYRDGGSPVCVRVSQGGTKTFMVMLGSGKRYTIGRWGEITLAQAREAARRLRAEKTLGRILPVSISLADARDEYLAQVDVRENTRLHYTRNLSRMRGGRLSDIAAIDVHRIIDDLGDAAAHQAFAALRAFFNWCERRNYLERSPCARILAPKPTEARSRVLADDEIKAIWNACEGTFGTIVRLLLLTGQRRGEIAGLRAEWVNFNDRTITLPPTATKNGRQHTFPFGSTAKSLLEEQSPTRGLLFPARGNPDTVLSGWSKSKRALDRAVPLPAWTLHDLRRTFASNLQRLGVRIEVTERLLNHISGSHSGIVGVYQRHSYMNEMQSAVGQWEKRLAQILVG